jgi:hypothetical protein
VRVVGAVDSVLRVPTEHEEQRNLVRWFRQTFGLVTKGGVRIFAIPNGSQRSRTTGAKLKAEGVSAGVPDLFVPAWTLWIEMKRAEGGSVSAEQRDWHAYLRSIGHTVLVCRGFSHAREEIEAFVKKM